MAGLNTAWSYDRAKRVADFNDKVTKLKWAFQDLAVRIIPILTPLVGALVDNFGKLSAVLGAIVAINVISYFGSLTNAVKALSKALLGLFGISITNNFLKLGSTEYFLGDAKGWELFVKIISGLTNKLGGLLRLLVTTPAGWGIIAVTALYGAFKLVRTELDLLYKSLKNAFTTIPNFEWIKELYNTIKDRVIPIWEGFKNMVSTAIFEIKVGIIDLVKNGIWLLVKSFEGVVGAVNILVRVWGSLRVAMLEVQKTSIDVANFIVERFKMILEKMQELIRKFNELTPGEKFDLPEIPEGVFKSFDTAAEKLSGVKDEIDKAKERFLKMGEEGSETLTLLTNISNELADAIAKIDSREIVKAAAAIKEAKKAAEGNGSTDGSMTAEEAAKNRSKYELKILTMRLDEERRIREEARQKEREETEKDFEKFKEMLKKKGELIAQLEQSSANFTNFLSTQFTDAFTQFLDGTKTAKDAFRDMAISILRDLSQMLIKMAIFNAMQQYMGGGVGGGILGSIGSFFGFQHGGHLKRGEPVVVGEAGPEIFMPDGSGTIMSNPNSQRYMSGGEGGGGTNIVVNVNRPVGSDVDAMRTGKLISNELKVFIDKRIMYQTKPGGILKTQPASGRI